MKTYAGIGSRSTPAPILGLITQIAQVLSSQNWTLHSGGARGADTAFLQGAHQAKVFLPWPNYNGLPPASHSQAWEFTVCGKNKDAQAMVDKFHPASQYLRPGVRYLHARNAMQILGHTLINPVKFVLCWTPDGCINGQQTNSQTGGTGQALRIATYYQVPIFNLAHTPHLKRLQALVGVWA